jgi:hypothetical protein
VTTCLALSIVSFQVNLLCYSAPVPYQTKELLVTYTIVQKYGFLFIQINDFASLHMFSSIMTCLSVSFHGSNMFDLY